MPRPSPGADEVRGDHGLAVAGRQRVQCAPAEGSKEQKHEHALAGRRALEEALEAALRAVVGGGEVAALGCAAR